ncbi:hypothetical protein EH2_01023 [Bacillus subtilis]|nr:hypothetical protein EH2_01023 [Bacillus subtilis]
MLLTLRPKRRNMSSTKDKRKLHKRKSSQYDSKKMKNERPS